MAMTAKAGRRADCPLARAIRHLLRDPQRRPQQRFSTLLRRLDRSAA